MEVVEVGKTYFIVYDDKGFKPVSKTGTIQSKEGNLILLTTGEILNLDNIIRAKEVSE